MYFTCLAGLHIRVFEYFLITKFLHYFFGVFLYGLLLFLQLCQVYYLANCKDRKR